jgi:hypothetical protein
MWYSEKIILDWSMLRKKKRINTAAGLVRT